jgi:alanyl-tRNA synthetase
MTPAEIRTRFLEFFKARGHAILPSASLVPENDPTTLFTASGMQPMVPYLLGDSHPMGSRIADSQKSFRTVDIEEVGDNRHTTFFEMLGNWSLGDYFKKEQIEWMFKFLTEEIGIDPTRLYITAFIGDEKNNIPKDTEAGELWEKLFKEKGVPAKSVDIGSEENGYAVGMQGGRIFYYDSKKNWWSRWGIPEKMPAGEPGGPDSEMFYEFTDVPHDITYGPHCHPNCDCGRFLEIGNNVFMQYKKNTDGTFSKLPRQNIDFGGGLERMVMAVQNCPDIIESNHGSIIRELEKLSGKTYKKDTAYTKAFRIVADHMKASVFLIGDGVLPSNTDRGYFVRRLLRRAVRYFDILEIKDGRLSDLVESVLSAYTDSYNETYEKKESITQEIKQEEDRFRITLAQGEKKLHKITEHYVVKPEIGGYHKGEHDTSIHVFKSQDVFDLYQTYGFPIELTQEILKEKDIHIDEKEVGDLVKRHQELSRTGAEQKFKGGLAGNGEMETKYHTTTHLLHQALRDVLGTHVSQKGSNITAERLRFDFTHSQKMTDEEKKKVEHIVNEKIGQALPIQKVVMKKNDAEKTGALHFFGDKYGDEVNVYFIGDSLETAYSKEFCGGPHITNTSELGHFAIQKEEAVSLGVRRIKAILT